MAVTGEGDDPFAEDIHPCPLCCEKGYLGNNLSVVCSLCWGRGRLSQDELDAYKGEIPAGAWDIVFDHKLQAFRISFYEPYDGEKTAELLISSDSLRNFCLYIIREFWSNR